MISNEQIACFRNPDLQAIDGIADEKLRKQALKLKNKQGGFTLLELLVVVGILAIVAGVMMGAMSGQEKRAASGAASNTIAAVESLLKGYQTQGTVLNDLDALEHVPATTALTPVLPATADAAGAQLLGSNIIGEKLAKDLIGTGDKIKPVILDQSYINSLTGAGITKVRVLASEAINEDTTDTCATAVVDGQALPCDKKMSEIDIPARMFDDPNGKNRGRGFSVTLPTSGGAVLPVWKSSSICDATTVTSSSTEAGTAGGLDNKKLGAKKCDVLVALGFGNNVIVGASSTPQMNSAPAYGGMLGSQYNRYILLYNVGKGIHASNFPTGVLATGSYLVAASAAKLQAVVDTRGDFLDEERAEASGQKQ